jgi:hypothetical protein
VTLRGKSGPGLAALVQKWKAAQTRLCGRMIIAPQEASA